MRLPDTTMSDPPPVVNNDYHDCLAIPPMDSAFLSQQALHFSDPVDQNDDVVLDDIDFEFSFDDLYLPPFNDGSLTALPSDPAQLSSQPEFYLDPNSIHPQNALKTTSQEFLRSAESSPASSNHSRVLNNSPASLSTETVHNSCDVSSYLNVESPETHHISSDRSASAGYVNVLSPESNGSNKELTGAALLNCPSPGESQGSGNCGSNVSEADSNKSGNSLNSSPDFDNSSMKNGVVDQKIKLEGRVKNENNCIDKDNVESNKNCILKRKKESGDSSDHNGNVDSRTSKYRRSCDASSNGGGENGNIISEEDEKRKARLMRNRESAQLSRQRKKHYVEELEDKVRSMHSTIQDLNAKISYVMTENATLRQQMGGGTVPPPMAPPPGMFPPPPMMYPWMPAPPYMVKPQGSQVPLVPIPRLKPQQPVSAPKTSKKAESKKNEAKTKKVASVSFLGLLFFMLLFGGLVPMVNLRYGGMRNAFTDGSNFAGNGLYERHHGRVLTVNGSDYGQKFSSQPDLTNKAHCAGKGHGGGEANAKHGVDEFVGASNGSEPLLASLYVPRNDKLVKIDGNLIIHSVLASEKAMASHEDHKEKNDETGLAVPGDLVPTVHRLNAGRHPHLALGSGAENDDTKSREADHSLHQWFREGLAGPMLSSGMCTEVFQFEVSPASAPGAIIPATSARNVTAERGHNSTQPSSGRNRRILHGLPIPLPGSSAHNVSDDCTGRDAQKRNFTGTDSASSMVVSVLMDPREAADAERDGVMGPKSLSRIFVVVLIDSVKYVTYSCMLPFKGSVPHLVTS